MIYYHNPRCSKSRQALALLEENNVTPKVKEYLKEGLKTSELDGLFKRLNKEPLEGMRTKETVFKELGLKGKELTRKEWLKVISENPVLLERPILDNGKKAVIGRPPEDILTVI
ncbi:MAG: arsenate reductase (glutaredoxin) [Bacteriovoracaceae bacterium]|nr:arsenate reductase (glutaredoxin) [Bacteriovoracaceae bacterium]